MLSAGPYFRGTGYHIQDRDQVGGRRFSKILVSAGVLVALIFIIQYSLDGFYQAKSTNLPEVIAHDEDIQLNFHQVINHLAQSLRPGVYQTFEFKGVHYEAKYIPGHDFHCFYDIKAVTGEVFLGWLYPDWLQTMDFKPPTEDCADGSFPHNAIDGRRVHGGSYDGANIDTNVVTPPPGLGTPQHAPSSTPAGAYVAIGGRNIVNRRLAELHWVPTPPQLAAYSARR